MSRKKKKITIPPNLTESEVLVVIKKVANRLARRFRFGYHDLDDMRQQAMLFAWEGMRNYDGERPLENFLTIHVRNRLFNFKRDKYHRPGNPCENCGNLVEEKDICRKFPDKNECENYGRWLKRNSSKKNIMNPIGIDIVDDTHERNFHLSLNIISDISYSELVELIDRELPANLRSLYLRLKYGGKLTKIQREKITVEIREILEKNGRSN